MTQFFLWKHNFFLLKNFANVQGIMQRTGKPKQHLEQHVKNMHKSVKNSTMMQGITSPFAGTESHQSCPSSESSVAASSKTSLWSRSGLICTFLPSKYWPSAATHFIHHTGSWSIAAAKSADGIFFQLSVHCCLHGLEIWVMHSPEHIFEPRK